MSRTRRWTRQWREWFPRAVALWCALCLTLVLLSASAAAADLRCERGLVSRGDSAAEVMRGCGEPDHVERWQARPPASSGAVWFYNDGPSRLLRVLRFRGERLVAVGNDGYGFRTDGRADCRPGDPVAGWSAYRLLARCGEPDEREIVGTLLVPLRERTVGTPLGAGRRTVFRQRWRYDFGPRTLMREVTLDNAKISDVRTLDRGS